MASGSIRMGSGRAAFAALAVSLLTDLLACRATKRTAPPSIEFTMIPEAGPGGPASMQTIGGRVTGARAGQRIVLFASSGKWWVQPFWDRQFTIILPDFTWKNSTHLGNQYAALLVDPGYNPPATATALPRLGGGVAAVATISGRAAPAKTIHFSGYEWAVREVAGDSGGVPLFSRATNVSTDASGRLHLRIAREAGGWTCAEIELLRSLGYGSYAFVVGPHPPLEPATALSLFTWDATEADQNGREIDIELSQWGDPAGKNTQYVIQPYYVPANVFRFIAPADTLTHSFEWTPGRVSFQTRAGEPGKPSRILDQHVFTSGVPTPGDERVHIKLYLYGKSRTPQQNGVEVVIEKFEYLP